MDAIKTLMQAHDKLMLINLSAQDAITFAEGILMLRNAIAELEKNNESADD